MRSRADTHVHTYFSGTTKYKALKFPESVTTPKEQVDRAIKNGYSVICITDHNTIKGGICAKNYASGLDEIDVVVGSEINSRDGEIIGLWLNEEVPKGLPIEETLDLIRSQGGVAIAPHPFSFYVHCLGERIFDLDIDGIEVLNGGHPDGYTNARAQMVCEDNPGRWAQISASDAHSTYTAGYAWTEFEGEGEDDLRKAILSKTTVPQGRASPVFTQVQWSIEVVSRARKMIGKSLVNRLPEDPDNPVVTKIHSISSGKKIAGFVGGLIYITPPFPFIGTMLSTTWLKRRAQVLTYEFEMKFRRNSSKHMDEYGYCNTDSECGKMPSKKDRKK